MVNAIFYLNKTGYQWRYLPKCFPLYTLVSYYHHKWVDRGILEKINTAIRQELRQEMGRNANPSAVVAKLKTTVGGFQGLSQRWIVERTFAWLGRSRRLSKDYERKPTSSAGHVYLASTR